MKKVVFLVLFYLFAQVFLSQFSEMINYDRYNTAFLHSSIANIIFVLMQTFHFKGKL